VVAPDDGIMENTASNELDIARTARKKKKKGQLEGPIFRGAAFFMGGRKKSRLGGEKRKGGGGKNPGKTSEQ